MAYSVLVITDSIAEQVRLLLILTAAGYVPTCCDGLSSATVALEATDFDIIITDSIILDAPPQKMAAVELVSLLHGTSLNPTTPVLVMGDGISYQHIMNTLQSGVARFIPKPFTPAEFLETIKAELTLNTFRKNK